MDDNIDCSGLLDTILEASQVANPEQDKTDLLFATVLNTNPISIRIDESGLEIPSNFIAQSPFCFTNTITIPDHVHIVPAHETEVAETEGQSIDFEVEILENDEPSEELKGEGAIELDGDSHNHNVAGQNTEEAGYYQFDVWEGLKVGEKVLVIRANGGQLYFIVCKV